MGHRLSLDPRGCKANRGEAFPVIFGVIPVPGSSSGLGHRPLTAKITGSNPVPGTIFFFSCSTPLPNHENAPQGLCGYRQAKLLLFFSRGTQRKYIRQNSFSADKTSLWAKTVDCKTLCGFPSPTALALQRCSSGSQTEFLTCGWCGEEEFQPCLLNLPGSKSSGSLRTLLC